MTTGATLDDISQQIGQLGINLGNLLTTLQSTPSQIITVNGLSDISGNLGTVMAGEFRAGNQVLPGKGFSGTRIAYPAMSYNSQLWHIAGVNNDVLQFGVNSLTGQAIAGGGAVTLDVNGITILAGQVTANTVTWTSGGSQVGAMYAYHDTGGHLFLEGNSLLADNPTYGTVQIKAAASAGAVGINLSLYGGANQTPLNYASFWSDGVLGMYGLLVGAGNSTTKPSATLDVRSAPNNTIANNIPTFSASPAALVGATTETSDYFFGSSGSHQFAHGSVPATQRATQFAAPTYTSSAASDTITTAATVAIANAPTAGTNMAITNSYALWVQAGNTLLAGGLNLGSATGAPTGAVSMVVASGVVPIRTTAGAGGQWQVGQNVSVSGGDDTFGFYSATYGSGHSSHAVLQLSSTGSATFDNNVTFSGNILSSPTGDVVLLNSGRTASTAAIVFLGSAGANDARIRGNNDGTLVLPNGSLTVTGGINVGTGSGATAGQVVASAELLQANNKVMGYENLVLANGGLITIPNFRGLMLVSNITDNICQLIGVTAAGTATSIASFSLACNLNSDAGTTFAVFYSSGWVVKNRYGVTKALRVQILGN